LSSGGALRRYPATEGQQRLWFLEGLEPDNLMHVNLPIELVGELGVAELE
jgi:hypothetical protein